MPIDDKDGWVKLWRKVKKKAWWKKSQYAHLWTHLMLEAAHERHDILFNNQIITIEPGQLITGKDRLSADTGIPRTTIGRILTLFENGHQIGQQINNAYRLITMTNWCAHQTSGPQNGQPVDPTRTPRGPHADAYKNVKNDKNDKKAAAGSDHKDFNKLRERLQMDAHLSTMIGGLVPRDYLNGLLAEFDYSRIDAVATELSEYVSGLRYKPTAIKLMEWLPDRCRRFNPHPKPRQGQKPDETETMVSEFTKRWNARETRRGGEPSSIGDVIKQGGGND